MFGLRACRLCLITDVRMFDIHASGLEKHCEAVTGTKVCEPDHLPPLMCYECAALAAKFLRFRQRSVRAQEALLDCLHAGTVITESSLRSLDREARQLTSNLSLSYNHYEVSVAHSDSEQVKQELSEDIFINNAKCSSGNEKLEGDDIKSEDFDDYAPSPRYSDRSDDDLPLAKRKLSDTLTDVKKVKRITKKKSSKHKTISDKTLRRERKLKKVVLENLPDIVDPDLPKRKAGRKKFEEEFATVISLTHEEQMEEIRKRQYSLNYTNSPYKCGKCFKGFVDEMAFRNHMVRHDLGSGEFVCAICEIRCMSERKLRSHLVAAHARKYACRACDHVSNTSNQAREHDKWHRGFTYACQFCGETFRKSTTHLTHVRLRHPTEFVCDICGDSFVGTHGLAMHKKRTHKDQQVSAVESRSAPYCQECGVQFTSVLAWKRHTVTSAKHSTNNHFGTGCRLCGDTFASEAELGAHARSHAARRLEPLGAPQPAKCDQCGAEFASARKCLAHYKRMHLGLKYPIKKNVVCEVCGKKCTSNATLAYHQRTHTGEKPFQCAECPKRFSIRQRLQIHERTHTGERPYPCPACPKAFRHKPALNRHSRVHTGAKPYECKYCGKTFSQSNSMKLHVHTVHLKLPPPYRNKHGKSSLLTALPPEPPLLLPMQRF